MHIFRHSAAQLHRDDGESVEDVSRFLDHSSLAVTTTYLRRLEGQEDQSWAKVAEAILGLVCDAPSIQFHQLQAVRSDDRDHRCSRSLAATFCLVATLSGPRFWRQTQGRS